MKTKRYKKKTNPIMTMIYIICLILWVWIIISTAQISLRIGEPQWWNCWEILCNYWTATTL